MRNIKELKDKYKGESCYVMGTGYSISTIDLDKIDKLTKEVISLKHNASIPQEILDDWDNEEDEVWNDF